MGRGIGMELGACSTVQAGEKPARSVGDGLQEHVVDEQGVPRVRRDEPDAQAVLRVRAGEQARTNNSCPARCASTDVLSRA